MISDKPIGVAGAGSIGCFVGGMYAAAGRRVALLARPRVIEEIEANGLRLTSFKGFERRIASNQLTLSEDPSILGNTGVVLVTVKSADTAGIADVISKHAPADAVIVRLQNGVGNVSVLRQRLPGRRVPGAVVGLLLGSMMKVDPEARSSMWEDLQRGRRTEIDYLQGLITEIADRHGLQVPLSRRVVALIKSAEAKGKGSPGLTPDQIRP